MNLTENEQRLEDLIKYYIENYTVLFRTLDSFFASLASLFHVKSGIRLPEIEEKLDEILLTQAKIYLYNGLIIHVKRSPIFTLHDYIENSQLNSFFNDLRKELFLYYKRIHNIIFE